MSFVCRFMSTDRKFREIKRETFASMDLLMNAVSAYYRTLGFHSFKIRDENDFDGGRITATTPGGRGGRNVAFYDYNYEEEG